MLLRLLSQLARSARKNPAPRDTGAKNERPLADAAEISLARCRDIERGGDLNAALECYRECVQLHPLEVNAHLGAASVLAALWRNEECLESLAAAHSVLPHALEIYSDYLLWNHLTAEPDPARIFGLHVRFGEIMSALVPPSYSGAHLNSPEPLRPLRVGYVSRNFLRHSVAFFAEPVLACHDRTRHRVYCYYTHTVIDETTRRIAEIADVWRHVAQEDDEALARRIYDDRIDVLVDLGGHTKQNRLGVFARQPAPVQITWLGYPDTSGVPGIGYRISDAIADPPPAADERHTERLLRLTAPFVCYRPAADSPPVSLREANAPVVFGCFNMLAKVNAKAVELWAHIMREVPDSRMILKSAAFSHEQTAERVLHAFEACGIARERVALRRWAEERTLHLAAYGEVDIALDTFPYNGTTTTCEALWMGVPVITLAGELHMARVGASLLAAVGLGELVAKSADEYVAAAVSLARDGARRRHLRSGMRARLESSRLLDAVGYTRAYEDALRLAWNNWCAAQTAG